MRRLLLLGALAAAGAALALAAESSQATFRGKNGLLLFARYPNGHQQVFTVRPDGTGVRQVTHFPNGDAFDARWSPDAKLIALTHHWGPEPNRHFEIAIVNADGSGMHTLPIRGRAFGPSWIPDGHRLLIGLTRPGPFARPGSFAIVTTGGKVLRELRVPSRTTENGAWVVSPDGKWIAMSRLRSPEKKAAVFTIRVRDDRIRRITPWSQQVANFIDWSPDGSWITFSGPLFKAQAGGVSLNVYAIRRDGTGLVQLTRSTGGTSQNQAGAWSPDGRKIAFKRCAVCTGGDQAIYTMNADGTHVKRLTGGDVPASWGSQP